MRDLPRPVIEAMVEEITDVKVLSLHHDTVVSGDECGGLVREFPEIV